MQIEALSESLIQKQELLSNFSNLSYEDAEMYDYLYGTLVAYDQVAYLINLASTHHQNWESFIREIGKIRETNFCEGPLYLTPGIIQFAANTPLLQEEMKSMGKELDDLREDDLVRLFGRSLQPDLRESFLRKLAVLTPDVSQNWLNKSLIIALLNNRGITHGTLLDLGCGTGEQTIEWHQQSKMRVIGIDRQFNKMWYAKNWLRKEEGLNFLMADFNQGLPFNEKTVDAIVMEYVVQHIPYESLVRGLTEAYRILKPQGILAVGPEHSQMGSNWRVFERLEPSEGFAECEDNLSEFNRH